MGSVSGVNSLLSSLSSTTSSSSINLSSLLQAATGAATPGIDVTSAVNAGIYAAQAPERQWQAEQSDISAKLSALTAIQTALTKVNTDLQDLGSTTGSLSARTVTSSQPAVSASATSSAPIGNRTVSVQNLATAASWYSPVMESTTALGTSALTITSSKGSTYSFPVSPNASMGDLAAAINSSSAGVTANVVHDANGSRLSLVSTTTGSSADFTVTYAASGVPAWTSATARSSSEPLSAGRFDVSDGASTAQISVQPGDTLTSLADTINAAGLRLNASVVTTASGASLRILPASGSNISVSADPVFTLTRAATAVNAALSIDGVPISSATNTVSGALPGLTLDLAGTTTSGNPASLNVAADSATIERSLSNLVSDYNSALATVNAQFSFSGANHAQGPLGADSNVRSIQSALLSVGGYSAHAGSGNATIKTLAGLGITMADDGTLSIDDAKLSAATSDPSGLQLFFQGDSKNGFAQSLATLIQQSSDPATGSIKKEIQNLNEQYTALGSQVTDYESGYIASQRSVLTAIYSKAEIALQQLPSQMKQIQAQLGNNSSGG